MNCQAPQKMIRLASSPRASQRIVERIPQRQQLKRSSNGSLPHSAAGEIVECAARLAKLGTLGAPRGSRRVRPRRGSAPHRAVSGPLPRNTRKRMLTGVAVHKASSPQVASHRSVERDHAPLMTR
jgi:hypothetical protein